MIATSLVSIALRTASSALRRAVVAAAIRVGDVARALTHRGEVRRLLEMDDRALRDIGLTRSDVLCALAEPLAADPSAILSVGTADRRRWVRGLAPASGRVEARKLASA